MNFYLTYAELTKKIATQPFHLLKEERLVSVEELHTQLSKNPNLTANIKDFKAEFFNKSIEKFKAASELLQSEKLKQVPKLKETYLTFSQGIKDLPFGNETLEPEIVNQLDNLKQASLYKGKVAFFMILVTSKHRPYLASQINSKDNNFKVIANREQRKSLTFSHDNRFVCKEDTLDGLLKMIKKDYPLVPVLVIKDVKKPFFYQGDIFDKIKGKWLSQSKKINQLLDLCLSKPKLMINSPTGSGKTHFAINLLIPKFEQIYKSSLYVIIVTPRNTLNGQIAEEYPHFTNFSSSDDAKRVSKFNPELDKRVVTSLASAPKIIRKIKEIEPYANIVLIQDEAHALYEHFQKIQDYCSLINNQDVKHVIGFTATAHRLMFQDWEIVRFDRTQKHKRNIFVSYTYADKQLEARHQALALIVDTIQQKNYKTTMGFVSGVKEVARLQELARHQLASSLKENKGDVYAFTGQSTPQEIKKNLFLQKVLNEGEPLIGSHFFNTKAVDVGVSIKPLKSGERLDAVFYVAESNHDFLNLITFIQYVSRSRAFELMDIHIIIPINTTSKDSESRDFDLKRTFERTDAVCKNLNAIFQWASDARALLPDVVDECRDIAERRVFGVNKAKDTRLQYIWFNVTKSQYEVYQEKIIEELILREAKSITKAEAFYYFNEFFDCNITENIAQYSETHELNAIKKRTDKAEEEALAFILESLKGKSEIKALAMVLYHQTANPNTCEKLAKSFNLIGRNGLVNLNNNEIILYKEYKDNFLIEILLVKDKLTERLFSFHSLQLLTKNKSDFFDAIREIAFFKSRQKTKQTINRLLFFNYNRFVEHNSRAAVFKLMEDYEAILNDKTFLYYKSIFKLIKKSLSNDNSIDSTRLLSFVNHHNNSLKETDIKQNFKSEKELIHFLRNFYMLKTDIRKGKRTFELGDIVSIKKSLPSKEDFKGYKQDLKGYKEAKIIKAHKKVVLIEVLNKETGEIHQNSINVKHLDRKSLIQIEGFFPTVHSILYAHVSQKINPSQTVKNEAKKESQVIDNQVVNEKNTSLSTSNITKEKAILNDKFISDLDIINQKKETQRKKELEIKKIIRTGKHDYSAPINILNRAYFVQDKKNMKNYASETNNDKLFRIITVDLEHKIHYEIRACYFQNIKISLNTKEIEEMWAFIAKNGYGKSPNYVNGNLTFDEFCRSASWFVEQKSPQYIRHKEQFEEAKRFTNFDEFDKFVIFCERNNITYTDGTVFYYNGKYRTDGLNFTLRGKRGYYAYCRKKGISLPVVYNDKPKPKKETQQAPSTKPIQKQGKIIDRSAALANRKKRMAERKKEAQNYNRNNK